MLKKCRWLPPMLLVLGVWIATPACAVAVHSPRGDYRQSVQQRAYERGHRKGFDLGRDDARRGRPQSYERYKEYRNADDAIAVMTATATPIAVYSGKDFVTATRRHSMSDAMATTGTGGANCDSRLTRR